MLDDAESKIADLQSELKTAENDYRALSQEMNKLKAQLDDAQSVFDNARKDNKKLAGKIKCMETILMQGRTVRALCDA